MSITQGINHLGLAVKHLETTRDFFCSVLDFQQKMIDPSYPRASVSNGFVTLTLWQVDHSLAVQPFHRRQNIGLHHLALTVETEQALHTLYDKIKSYPGCVIEFAPELLSGGPRKHMMFCEPGGIRIELTWNG